MAKDDSKKQIAHECVYLGRHEVAMEMVEKIPTAPSAELARMVALSILDGDRGSYHPSFHFGPRTKERNFDVFDMEYAIRNGKCIEAGEYFADRKNHKYVFRCDIDGVEFDAVVALSAEHDLIKSPLMILVTGVWKTNDGKRRKRY